jgi:cobalt-zinc-cadmium efflux system outer membrane protein
MRPITLEDAVAWALLHNPELAAFEWELRAVEARAVQARLRHNPELRLEVEEARLWPGPSLTTHSRSVNLGLGSAEFELPLPSGPQTISVPRPATSWRIERETEDGAPSGFGEAEVTLSLSQVIELGGKRAARLRQARREHEVAAWDYEAARANVLAEVAAAFVDVSVAQRRVELDRRLERIEDERRGAIDQSVASGKVSPLESEAAATAVSLAKVRLIASEQGLARARVRLAATWGSHFPGFARVDGRLDALSAPAPLETLLALREQNPDVARWSAELALREAGRDVARSRGVPDLTVTFGFRTQGTQSRSIRRFGFGGGLEAGRADLEWDRDRDNTFVFGASMPLPVFNRNQGAIRESEYQISQATEQRQAADARAMVSITQAHQELAQALETLRVLDEEVVPAARRTFEQTKAGHEKGKFGYRDVLDAERALLEVDHRRIDALHAYHDAAIRLDRLTGSLPPDDDTEE